MPPNTEAGRLGLTVPEMQITSETSASSYLNFVESMAFLGSAGFLLDLKADYTDERAIADDVAALVARMDERLMYGSMSPATRALMTQAIESVPIGAFDARANRVRLAILFAMSSPDFIVQR